MQNLFIIFGVFCAAMIGSSVQALTCYESNQDGDLVEVDNDDFTFCVLMPERIEGNKFIEGKAFGIGPNSDSTGMYDKVFSLNTNLYQVLTMCLYERYNFDKISSKFTFKQPEFLLRCFCNTDRCNSEKTFTSYIDNLRIDSSIHRAKALGRSA